MNIGERIKAIRTEKKISVDYLARELGVSKTTIYRYEDSSIEKIPVGIFDKICNLLGVTPAELMGNAPSKDTSAMDALPHSFDNAQDAMAFILKTPTLAAFGGYDPNSMDDDTIISFANEILRQLELVAYKYKSQINDNKGN